MRTLENYAKLCQERLTDKDKFEPIEDVNKRIMETLKVRTPAQQEKADKVTSDTASKSKDEDLEDWLNDYLS